MKSKRRLLPVALAVTLALVALVVLIPPRHEQLYKVTPLPSLSAWLTYAYAVNDHGEIAGIDGDPSGKDHLFLWDHEKGMQDLGPALRWRADINNKSCITAWMRKGNVGKPVAVLLEPVPERWGR